MEASVGRFIRACLAREDKSSKTSDLERSCLLVLVINKLFVSSGK